MIAGFLVSLIMSFSAARRQTVPSAGVQGSIYEKYIRREQGRGRKKNLPGVQRPEPCSAGSRKRRVCVVETDLVGRKGEGTNG